MDQSCYLPVNYCKSFFPKWRTQGVDSVDDKSAQGKFYHTFKSWIMVCQVS